MNRHIKGCLLAAAALFAAIQLFISQGVQTVSPALAPSQAVPCSTSAPYVGRFRMPSVGVDVACYESMEQTIVDAKDSAAYFSACGHTVIGDHVNQGFSAIKSAPAGTQAQLLTQSGETDYTCIDSIQGRNTGTELTDMAGNSISELHPGALVCYTCNVGTDTVTLLFLSPDCGESQSPENTPYPSPNVSTTVTQLDGVDVVIGPTYRAE